MNRFSDPGDSNYRLVCEEIVRLVDSAPGRINGRRICERFEFESQRDTDCSYQRYPYCNPALANVMLPAIWDRFPGSLYRHQFLLKIVIVPVSKHFL